MAHGAGCGCKVAPALLQEMLQHRLALPEARLLVGNDTADDAAAWLLEDGTVLLSTTDFFTPLVDDPERFGRIAAANALSDIYAMGGKPLLAIAVMGFPVDKLPVEMAAAIMKGAMAVASEAGIRIAGGHTIDAPEPFFGLSVNGLVKQEHLKRNGTAREGDLLYLTKRLGTGMLATAFKRGMIDEAALQPAVESMTRLNSIGAALGKMAGVHAMTDVTGFGLLGHLSEMCNGSRLSARLFYSRLQLLEGVPSLVKQMVAADNTYRNWNAYEAGTRHINGESLLVLCDPQTNGGLLLAADPAERDALESLLRDNGLDEHATPIGSLEAMAEATVELVYDR